jgi:hypothetical protein
MRRSDAALGLRLLQIHMESVGLKKLTYIRKTAEIYRDTADMRTWIGADDMFSTILRTGN